jgi:APA family basic amino acid/polyamine antiporter
MAADRLFLPVLARLHPRYRTPSVAILLQSTWSCILVLTGRYEQLLNYVVFADWIFFGLTVLTVVIFRRRVPPRTRPAGSFLTPGYPVVPVAFSVVAAAVVLSVIWADPSSALRGAVLLLAGIPIYYWYLRRSAREDIAESRIGL